GLRRMGTDPEALLVTLLGYGYSIRVVEEGMDALVVAPNALVDLAERRRYVNLLLERPVAPGGQG
ncbi:MAG TPA: hypothetical protein VNU02_07435, partial [Candidatus Dormibacteraeota bacterium]|nr:hypothetical protein [Candidatus Dormibacteraeota bacterium]